MDKRDLEDFQTDGVTVIRDVLDRSWLDRLAEAIEANMASPGPHGKNHAETGGAYFTYVEYLGRR